MRIFLNPYDSDAKRKRIEALNKIKGINEKIDTMHKQVKNIGRRNNYEIQDTKEIQSRKCRLRCTTRRALW